MLEIEYTWSNLTSSTKNENTFQLKNVRHTPYHNAVLFQQWWTWLYVSMRNRFSFFASREHFRSKDDGIDFKENECILNVKAFILMFT